MFISRPGRKFTLECCQVTKLLPSDERFAMVQQLRRAALSVHLNLAEGASGKSPSERNPKEKDIIKFQEVL